MRVDVLVAEIGSTTTVVNAFQHVQTSSPLFLGQGQAPTTVGAGDVRTGLSGAVGDLRARLGVSRLDYDLMLATSSAAGGLRMTVHGLVYDMTVRAGREAALGAGANIHLTTAGKLTRGDLDEVRAIMPNLILLAGGTDYGERETALHNARMLCSLDRPPPLIYAGNVQNRKEIQQMFERRGHTLYITENVYPRLDELNIEPVRRLIHRAFEEHITNAPGMRYVRDMVTGPIMPTPGAVMECAKLLYGEVGDLIVLDVGGATTDVHSVADGSEEIASMQISPEPKAKRTVEGDLGVYVNARSLAEQIGLEVLDGETGLDTAAILERYLPIPESEEQFRLTERLAFHAASMALQRHAGRLRHTFGASGRRTWAEGKDLTKVRRLVATGGALTRLPGRRALLDALCGINTSGALLYPRPGEMQVLEDGQYIMASLGVLSTVFPDAALRLLKASLTIDEEKPV